MVNDNDLLNEEILSFESKAPSKKGKMEENDTSNIIKSSQELDDEWDKMFEQHEKVDNDHIEIFDTSSIESNNKFNQKLENMLENVFENFYKKLHGCIREGVEKIEEGYTSTDEKVATIMNVIREDDRLSPIDFSDLNFILNGSNFNNMSNREHRFKRREHQEMGHRAQPVELQLKEAENIGNIQPL